MGMTMRIDGEIFSDEVNSVNFGVRQVKQSSTGGVVKEMVGVSTSTFSTKTATVVLIVHGTHRDAIRTRCDEIVKASGLGTPSTFYNAIHLFSFSALSHSFRGVLKKYQMQELVPDRMTRLTLTLEGLEETHAGQPRHVLDADDGRHEDFVPSGSRRRGRKRSVPQSVVHEGRGNEVDVSVEHEFRRVD